MKINSYQLTIGHVTPSSGWSWASSRMSFTKSLSLYLSLRWSSYSSESVVRFARAEISFDGGERWMDAGQWNEWVRAGYKRCERRLIWIWHASARLTDRRLCINIKTFNKFILFLVSFTRWLVFGLGWGHHRPGRRRRWGWLCFSY